MNRWIWLVAGCWLVLLAGGPAGFDVVSSAHAQASETGPTASKEPPSASKADQAQQELDKEPEPWKGPRVQLSYRIYSLHDWQGGGVVNSAAFSGFLPTRYVRAGGGVEAGARAYEYGSAEGLLSGHLFAGYQHISDLGRLVPYLVAMGEYGFTFGKRFHTTQSRSYRGIGLEFGTSVHLIKGLHVGVGVSFMVYTMDDLRYDTWGLRLSIGL